MLDASRAGPADLFACIAGQKTPLCGHIAINGVDSDDLLRNYEQLHGNVSFQPRFDNID